MKVKYIGITNGFLTNGKEYEVRGISVSGDVGVGCAFPASEFLLVKEQKHNFKVGDYVRFKDKYAGMVHFGCSYEVVGVNKNEKSITINVVMGTNAYHKDYYTKYFRLAKDSK